MRPSLRLFVLLALCAAPLPALARPVRIFVVNPRLELRYADTYASFREKMFALVDAGHPRRAELVQADVLDIAAHLRPRDPNAPAEALIVFPEDVGLVAGLIGSRGAAARATTLAEGGSTTAFLRLVIAYQPLIAFYNQRFPNPPALRNLFVGATDTYYRAFYETFRELAMTYDVHVAASVNVAPARRITVAENAALVAQLRDPDEPQRDYAYEAVAGTPVNTLFVFAPDGELLVLDAHGNTVRSPSQTDGVLRGSFDKAYLTELEQSPLGLAYGAVRGLDVLDTAVGRLASVTSKDAWMVDVNDRYDAKRPEVIIQAEAFDQWAFGFPWAPDGFKAGGFAQVQRNPSFRYNLTSDLVGNLFDVTFDGQGAILGKRRKDVEPDPALPNAWIGQNADSGFLAVAPWIAADPIVSEPGLGLDQRRIELVEQGVTLLPGSGIACSPANAPGACDNGYRESILMADLSLPEGPEPPGRIPGASQPTAFGDAKVVDPGGPGGQRQARIAAHDGSVYVAWQDGRAGVENIYLAVSADGGASYATQRVSDNPAGATVELRPDVAVSPDGASVYVAWQEFCVGRDDDCGRIKLARFDASGAKQGADVRVDTGADEAGKWNPALATDRGGNPLVAWVDERDRSPAGLPLEHIYFSRGHRGRMSRNVRVDRGAPVAAATELDNKWAPTIAVQSRSILVAWSDFRNYQWDVYTARSRSGRAFQPSVRVDDAQGFERIHDRPALAADGRGRVHALWADRRGQEPDTDIRAAFSTDGARHFSPSIAVDRAEADLDPDRATPSNQWHPAIAVAGDDVFAVWQDNRLGDNDIFFARSRDAGISFDTDERVDDSGTDASDQYRPDIAVDPGKFIYVAWEDERYGPARVVVARRAFE